MTTEPDIFKQFIFTMNDILDDNSKQDSRDQQTLLEDLFKLERKFKKTLISTMAGQKVYSEFIRFIMEEKRNILSARVYFRERQEVFSGKISRCFKETDPLALHEFSINHSFVSWVCKRYKGPKSRSLNLTFKKIIELRKILCENNIPLAINRAKLFWARTPYSHLEYMDFIQDANEGLLTAIDKFVPPYRTVFRSVAIGRMTLNMITDSSATMIRLSPTDKRILYRANNARTKEKLTDIQDILDYVNISFKKVDKKRLEGIIAATHSVSSLDKTDDEDNLSMILRPKEEGLSPEESFLSSELLSKVKAAMNNVSIIEMKLIKMKFGMERNA